jgi:uncharacterized protein
MTDRITQYFVASDRAYAGENGEAVRLLFATRTASTLMVDADTASALVGGELERIRPELLDDLCEAEVVLPDDGADELRQVLNRNRAAAADPSALRYVLVPTSFCNMGCAYCGQVHRPGGLSPRHRAVVRQRVVDGIRRPTTKSVEIGWFGGEPMVAYPVIRWLSTEYTNATDAAGTYYSAKMTTNGSLMSAEKLRVLAGECRLHHLEITLDGLAEVHDRHRPLKAGGGSFFHVIDVLEQALSEPDSLQALHIVLRTNIDIANCDHIDEYIDWMGKRGTFANERVSFSLNPIHSWGNDVSELQLAKQEYAQRELDWLRRLDSYGLQFAALPMRPKKVICTAVTRNAEVISSSGRIFSCTEFPLVPQYERDEVALVRIDDPELAAQRPAGPFDDWNDGVERGETPCQRCVFLPTCGGHCPKLWREGHWPCPSYKFNVQGRFDLIAAQSGLAPLPTAASA